MSSTATSHPINTLNVISSQIQNLLNVHVTKFINTGDRIIDNGLTIIIHSCIALIGAYLYTVIINIATYVYNYLRYGRSFETDNPMDIDHCRFDYSKWTTDVIKKYPHYATNIPNLYNNIDRWISANYTETNVLKATSYFGATNGHLANIIISGIEGAYFMPVWKYKNMYNETKYVWVVGYALYSESFKALDDCYNAIYTYAKTSNTNITTTRYIYIPAVDTGRNSNSSGLISIGEVDIHKTFNNIYYDQKQTVIDLLDKFTSGTMYPNNLCTNKCGILLYGPPGTGKTGTISAIANYLQRDIVMVHDLSSDTLKELNRILETSETRNKYVIVFDEFDHILCDNRNEDVQLMKEIKLNKLREHLRDESDDNERKKIQAEIKTLKDSQTSDVGLGELLRFLDGITDQTNRIVVATTNQPDKINERLLRPGRFDLKLELGYCSMQMFCDIVQNVFPNDIARLSELTYTYTLGVETTINFSKSINTDNVVDILQTTIVPMETHIARLLEKHITPLALINTCLVVKSFDELIEKLNVFTPDAFTYIK